MSATKRRLDIFEKLKKEGKVVIADLAEEFKVTPMTIRRDLVILEKQGIVTTYYGGASLNEGAAIEPSFSMKNNNARDEKTAIAYEASKLINEGDTVYIDCGTTCYNISRFLKNMRMTVVTNSISLINALKDKDKISIAIAPGMYSRVSEGALSSTTIEFFQKCNVDKAFVATQGFDITTGASVPEEMDGKVKSSVLPMSEKVILLVDHTKFGQKYFSIHGAPSDYDMIITDEGISEDDLKKCQQAGLPLKVARYLRKRK